MTQNKITLDRLKNLAFFTEEKFQELHPDVKNGDCIDVGEYLELLFDLMISVGVLVPPVRIGDHIYFVFEDFDDVFDIDDLIIEGLGFMDDSWWFCSSDQEWFKFDENCFFERASAEKAISEKLNK